MDEKRLSILASAGLAVGGILGLAGTFAPSAFMRSLMWGVDGLGLVMACAALTIVYYRNSQERVASGVQLLPTSSALPFFADPFFAATFCGWIWALCRTGDPEVSGR